MILRHADIIITNAPHHSAFLELSTRIVTTTGHEQSSSNDATAYWGETAASLKTHVHVHHVPKIIRVGHTHQHQHIHADENEQDEQETLIDTKQAHVHVHRHQD
jgi:hypothetical protein